MGCANSVQSQNPKGLQPYKLNKQTMPLEIQLKLLRNTLQVKKMKLQGSLSRNILELQKMFKHPLRSRNKIMEYQKIQESTCIKNEAHIYGVIISYLKVLQEYKHLLKDPEHISQLKPPIINILYVKSAIQSDDLEQFCGSILKQFPSLKQNETEQDKIMITDEIVKHHVNERLPTKKMINQFAMGLNMQTQDGITLSVINGTGNNFHYD